MAFLIFGVATSLTTWAQSAGKFQFTAAQYNAGEGDGTVRLTVTRVEGDRGKVEIQYQTSDGSATNEVQYTGATNTLVFNDFQTSAQFDIEVAANSDPTGNLDFNVALGEPSLVAGGDRVSPPELGENPEATVTIVDDDVPMSFNFAKTVYRVGENAGSIDITVNLAGGGGDGVSVDYTTVAGGFNLQAGSDFATEDEDFTVSSGTLTFGEGQASQTITIPILPDDLVEFNEDFQVLLENPQGEAEVESEDGSGNGGSGGSNGGRSLSLASNGNGGDGNGNGEPTTAPFVLGPISTTTITILFNGAPDQPQPAGAVDQLFNPANNPDTVPPFNLTPGANNTVQGMALQPDGKIVIGGDFTAFNATPRQHYARVLTNGMLDVNFNTGAGANGFVSSVEVFTNGPQAGKIMLAGGFTAIDGVQRNSIARLNPNGSLDQSFNPGSGVDGPVFALALQDDGKVLIGGGFNSVDGTSQRNVARLNDDGSLDTSFDPGTGPNDVVNAIELEPSPVIELGAANSGSGPAENRTNINTRATSGTMEITYNFAIVPDTLRVYYEDNLIFDTGLTNNQMVVTNMDGTVETNVVDRTVTVPYGPGSSTDVEIVINEGSGAEGTVWSYSAVIQPNVPLGVLIGGDFSSYNGVPQTRYARLEQDGTLDPDFNFGTGADGTVHDIQIQQDGRILLGGNFNSLNSEPRRGVARLNEDGTLDETFDPGLGADDAVFSLSLFPSSIVTASRNSSPDTSGSDTNVIETGDTSGTFSFNFDFGTNDTTFQVFYGTNVVASTNTAGAGSLSGSYGPDTETALRVVVNEGSNEDAAWNYDAFITPAGDNGGKILIGGGFTFYNSTRRIGVARLFPDGTLDTSFMDSAYNQFAGLPHPQGVAPNGFVSSSLIQTNGDVLIGGSFTRVGGGATRSAVRPRFNVARLVGGGTPGPGNFEFTVPQFGVDENGSQLSGLVSRSNGTLGSVNIEGATTDGTATAGEDYTATTNELAWASIGPMLSNGDTNSQFLPVPVQDDDQIEGDEVFNLDLRSPEGFVLLGGQYIPTGAALGLRADALGLIIENDFPAGRLDFAESNVQFNENIGTATLTVERTGGTQGSVSVSYNTSPGSASPGDDYVESSGSLTFFTGQSTKAISVAIRDDALIENDETFSVNLSNPSGGATLGTNAAVVATIVDNDFAPGRISFTSTNFVSTENSAEAVVSVRRRGGSLGVLTVDYATVSTGSAGVPFDYTETSGTLTWNDGETTTQTISIPIQNDGLVEGDETLGLVLENPSLEGALGEPIETTLTIQDDDFFGDLSFSNPAYLADENGTRAAIKVIRRQGSAETVSVNYRTEADTAEPGTDYEDVNGTLDFAVGETSKTFLVPVLDDGEQDGEKIVNLILSDPINGMLGNVTNATLSLIDDETINKPAGSLDTDFFTGSGFNGPVNAISLQEDGKILVGGEFSLANQQSRNRIARLNADGTLDGTFAPVSGANGSVRDMALQSDGRVLIAGLFTQVDGQPRNRLARVRSDGKLDISLNTGAGADNPVFAVTETFVDQQRKILIGGEFSVFNGQNRRGIARLNDDGTVDQNFNPQASVNGTVYVVVVQRDGKVLVGGDFSSVNGQDRNNIARFNGDGTLDAAFDAGLGPDASVRAIEVQTDDKILIGGLFDSVSGVPRNAVARLEPNGTLDAGFDPGAGADGSVSAIALQLDGRIVIGGDFTSFNGIPRNRIARLTEEGSLDPTINFGTGANGVVSALALQPDRMIVVGGGFTSFNNAQRNRLVRLHGGTLAGAGRLEFTQATFDVNEGSTNAVVTVRRTGGLAGPVSVDYATSAGSASVEIDYRNVSGTLAFRAGETARSFNVPLLDDNLAEADETVNLRLSNPIGGAELGNQPVGQLRIISDDSVLSFRETNFSTNENPPGGRANITVIRSGATAGEVTVNYFTGEGTAFPGQDFNSASGQVVFRSGETEKTFSVQILDDSQVEPNESVLLQLSSPSPGALLGQATATLTIFDNDFAPGILSFADAPSVSEGAGSATVIVQRTSGRTGDVSAQFSTSDGTAIDGDDYTGRSLNLSFVDGETAKSISIPVLDDEEVEGNETVTLTLSDPQGGAMLQGGGDSLSIPLTIVDDDFGPGSLDQEFNPGGGADGIVRAVKLQPDGKILAGGDFEIFNGFFVGHVARLNPDGSIDQQFALGTALDDNVHALGLQTQGRVVVGGAFELVEGLSRGFVGQFTTNGFIDVNFNRSAQENGTVFAVAPQPDGKVVIGGEFTSPSGGIARLNGNGSLDVSFNPSGGVNGSVQALALQSNGKVLIGGSFSQVGEAARNNFARLDAHGALDVGFAIGSGANGPVHAIAIQPDGKILIGGDFTFVHGVGRPRIARLNADGTVDPSFVPAQGANGVVNAIGLQRDGKVLIAGDFSTVNGEERARIARLNANGRVDPGFNPGRGPNGPVLSLAVQNDGKVVIGGNFTSVNGFNRGGIARLNGDELVPAEPVTLLSVTRLVDGQVRLEFESQPGALYDVEGSSDLVAWQVIDTVSATETVTEFTDTEAAALDRRFYRIRQVVP